MAGRRSVGMILVTGATGNVGREVVAALEARAAPFRAASRSGEGGVRLDYADPGTWPAALDGARTLFLLMPGGMSDLKDTVLRFADAARAAGVTHTVFLSVDGAADSRFLPHAKVERHLRDRPHTFLRPTYFAQNLDWALGDEVREGAIQVPAGRGRVAFVDLRDVGAAAAGILTDPVPHRSRTPVLTGPRTFDFAEAAALLDAALPYPVHYAPLSPPRYVLRLRRRGLGWGEALVRTWLHVGLRRGDAQRVDPALGRLIDGPRRDLDDYVRDHVAVWQRNSAPG